MLALFLSRLWQGAFVVVGVLLLTFCLLRLAPGGPFDGERQVPEHIRRAQVAAYGLDRSLPEQALRYVWQFLSFDFPPSPRLPGRSVGEVIAASAPVSALIGVAGLGIALAIGLPLGVAAALAAQRALDRWVMALSALLLCTPTLVLGPLLGQWFGLKLRWLNALGWEDPLDWVLPALTLGLIHSASIARLSRAGLREVLSQDFIRTARAKGLGERAVVWRHAMRLAILPTLNVLGPSAAALLTGSMVVETVFSVPGLGQHFVGAAINRNYELAMATAGFYAVLIVLFNLGVDGLCAWLDPRIGRRQP